MPAAKNETRYATTTIVVPDNGDYVLLYRGDIIDPELYDKVTNPDAWSTENPLA